MRTRLLALGMALLALGCSRRTTVLLRTSHESHARMAMLLLQDLGCEPMRERDGKELKDSVHVVRVPDGHVAQARALIERLPEWSDPGPVNSGGMSLVPGPEQVQATLRTQLQREFVAQLMALPEVLLARVQLNESCLQPAPGLQRPAASRPAPRASVVVRFRRGAADALATRARNLVASGIAGLAEADVHVDASELSLHSLGVTATDPGASGGGDALDPQLVTRFAIGSALANVALLVVLARARRARPQAAPRAAPPGAVATARTA